MVQAKKIKDELDKIKDELDKTKDELDKTKIINIILMGLI